MIHSILGLDLWRIMHRLLLMFLQKLPTLRLTEYIKTVIATGKHPHMEHMEKNLQDLSLILDARPRLKVRKSAFINAFIV